MRNGLLQWLFPRWAGTKHHDKHSRAGMDVVPQPSRGWFVFWTSLCQFWCFYRRQTFGYRPWLSRRRHICLQTNCKRWLFRVSRQGTPVCQCHHLLKNPLPRSKPDRPHPVSIQILFCRNRWLENNRTEWVPYIWGFKRNGMARKWQSSFSES